MLFSLQTDERDPLWRREMRERWRRPTTLYFLALYVLGLCWLAYLLYSALVPTGGIQLTTQGPGIGHRIFTSLLSVQIGAWIPLALLLAAPSIAAERERGSFTEYVLAGLSAPQILRAKMASLATFIAVLCALPLPTLALCFLLGGVEPLELAAGAFLEITVALTCAAMGLVISVNSARSVTAVKQGMGVALVLWLVEVAFVPPLLEGSAWSWLSVTAFLVGLMLIIARVALGNLQALTHNLAQDERLVTLPSLAVAATPRPVALPITLPEENVEPYRTPRPARTGVVLEPSSPSFLDVWVKTLARWNAVVTQDVRVGLRTSYARLTLAPGTSVERFLLRMVFSLGMASSALLALLGFSAWWNLNLHAALLGSVVGATVSSNGAFTRDREHKMLTQLHLCLLSPLEIIGGKVVATLLLMARSWGMLLLVLFGIGLLRGTGIALGCTLFVVLGIVTAIVVATTLSLLCRNNSFVTAGTLGVLLLLFLAVPLAPRGLLFFVPALKGVFQFAPFEALWLRPISIVIFGVDDVSRFGISLAGSFLRASCSLLGLNIVLLGIATWIWKRTRLDAPESGTRFWERDLSRSWR